jgi:DNA replication initiation complex subunit (GINS family)
MESVGEQKEINITYETLFELLRREKNRDELQSLSPSFYHDVVEYLTTKNSLMQKKRAGLEDYSSEESRMLLIQIDNTSKIIRELYERRERKIILMAMNKARTGSNIIDTTSLLDEEKHFYDDILELMLRYRRGVLTSLINARLPDLFFAPSAQDLGRSDLGRSGQHVHEQALRVLAGAESSSMGSTEADSGTFAEVEERMKVIRFLHSVPKFVGKELETYGPFEQEDVASLPQDIAKVLISKGRAEEIENN